MSSQNNLEKYIQAMRASPLFSAKVAFHQLLPTTPARYAPLSAELSESIKVILEQLGISTLFDHQLTAINLLKDGWHTVVATPTASGKSLIYHLPVIDQVTRNTNNRALYLYPLKALAQDQLQTLNSLLSMAVGNRVDAAIYDGDTNAYRRQKIRKQPPQILVTNPEMLHLSLLPFHEKWETFWAGLKYVVVDEVHTYRGVLGSHMSQVFRRLLRICNHYGARPVFAFTSATVSNPMQLCQNLTGLSVRCVDVSGAPKGKRHLVFLDPQQENPARTTIQLLKAALVRELRTIVYTKSRKYAELIALWSQHQAGRFAPRISAYRAGFLPEERRQIEARLTTGDLLAVVTTSALELGIDIGDLDLCILVGYPGSMVSTWQRGGRVGRSGQDSAIIMVASEDALDQYFLKNPEDFLQRPPESAVLNPDNPIIVAPHLECAASELPLSVGDPLLAGPGGCQGIDVLMRKKRIFLSADGALYHSRRKYPHRHVDLRGAGERYKIHLAETKEQIGEVDGVRAFRETHPGAVYLHQGRAYSVLELDLVKHVAVVQPCKRGLHTRVRSDKDIELMSVIDSRTVFGAMAYVGKVKVTDQVIGYDEIQTRTGKIIQRKDLDLPPQIIDTEGAWFIFPDNIRNRVQRRELDFRGGLHALEHVAIGILPLLVMVDRNDVGGFSTLFHEQTHGASVFIYDGIAGGLGTGHSIFKRAEALFEQSLATIESCDCDFGCPSCVHSPKCGSGNHPIDKSAAVQILKETIAAPQPELRDIEPLVQESFPATQTSLPLIHITADKPHFGVFDLETQKSAQEVGGWQNADRMRISCAVIYDSKEDEYFEYVEGQVEQLIAHLRRVNLVVGFNLKRFDYKVLTYYSDLDFSQLPTLDMLQVVHKQLGFRLSLDHLANATLGARKSADGLMALKWWREGRLGQIIDYCREDVRITRDLYLFGKANGHLLFRSKQEEVMRVPVHW